MCMPRHTRYCCNPMTKPYPLIAVVDDEHSICVALQRLFRSADMGVETYSSGEEFLEAVKTKQFDCVVLDLHMPKMNGYEVLCRLLELENYIPAAVITGHDTPEAYRRALSAGAAAYLRKPVDDFMLLDAVAKAVAS
jgi:FixJ family two-component response regulator